MRISDWSSDVCSSDLDLGTRRPRRRTPPLHLRPTPCRGLPLRQRAQGRRRQEGRSRHDLYADDPRGDLCLARLRADRRDPFGGVRRLLTRGAGRADHRRSEEHTSELQSLMRISYAVFCLKNKKTDTYTFSVIYELQLVDEIIHT